MPKFHKEVGYPEKVIIPEGTIYLEETSHARKEAKNDRYLNDDEDKLEIPDSIEVSNNNIFEIETDEQAITQKIACRVDYDSDRDLVLALQRPNGNMYSPTNKWKVKTVWINMKNDKHETLDSSNYDSEDYFKS
jgi:hypothetical protein